VKLNADFRHKPYPLLEKPAVLTTAAGNFVLIVSDGEESYTSIYRLP
jgi:hypothetical protein